MQGIIVIDGNSIGRASHGVKEKLHSGGQETQAIFHFFKMVKGALEKHPNHQPVVVWDGNPKWRFELYPEYKAKRNTPEQEADRAAYRPQRDAIQQGLKHLGVRQVIATASEADDVAASLVKTTLNLDPNATVVLLTGDSDWIGMVVSPRVTWADPIRDRTCTYADFMNYTKFENTVAFTQGKALTGDSSDNIPPVGGIGEKSAPTLLAEYGSVEKLIAQFAAGEKFKKKAYRDLATVNRHTFERNMMLVDLMNCPRPPLKHEFVVNQGAWNPTAFVNFCNQYAMLSIVRVIDSFLASFAAVGGQQTPAPQGAA